MKKHLLLAGVPLFAWALFYLIGIPSNYYMEWNLAEKILLSFAAFFGAIPLIGFLLLLFVGGDYVKNSVWASFYASIPLFLLDFIVVGVVQGRGIYYLVSHWYISIGYILVWPEIILMGLALRKLKSWIPT
jgi:hypothetical protein